MVRTIPQLTTPIREIHHEQASNSSRRHICIASSAPTLMFRRQTANGLHTISHRGASVSSLAVRCSRCAIIHAQHASGPYLMPPPSYVQVRGKKTKTTVKLSDLPQGVIQTEPLPEQETKNEPAYPTVVLQARRNMDKFDNCVLLTRVGGFYELYFEHADEFAPLLNLKLASKKTSAGPIPMVASPSHYSMPMAHDC